jgi:hypothetical protein
MPMRALVLATVVACGGKPPPGPTNTTPPPPPPASTADDTQVRADLDACTTSVAQQDKVIGELLEENARLAREAGATAAAPPALPPATAPTADPTADLEACQQSLPSRRAAITELEERNAKLATTKAKPIDDKAMAAAAKEFVDVVKASRVDLQTCYEAALKANASLRGKTVTLEISASFGADGRNTKIASSPSVDASFDGCIAKIGSAWKLELAQAMTFKSSVTLTPK